MMYHQLHNGLKRSVLKHKIQIIDTHPNVPSFSVQSPQKVRKKLFLLFAVVLCLVTDDVL